VEPWRVFNLQGQWYLAGYCQQAGGERLFRVDRISRVAVLEEEFVPPEEAPPASVFHGGPGDEVIVLELERDARWVAEQYPNEGLAEETGGRLRVTLRVSERAWLERVLLRAGTGASMIKGDPGIRSEAAARILARYQPAGAGSVS
jgi:proteasome accessory factor C